MRMWWERPAESFDKTCPCFIRLCGGLSPPRPKQLGKLNLKCHQRKCLSGNVCARACSFRSLKLLTMMVRVFSVPYRPHWLLTPSQPHMVLVWSQLCHCKGEGLFPPQGWGWWHSYWSLPSSRCPAGKQDTFALIYCDYFPWNWLCVQKTIAVNAEKWKGPTAYQEGVFVLQ